MFYTYRIQNKITNQFYYGSRYKNVSLGLTPIDDLWIKYFTSSKSVKELIKLYGKDSFVIEIIFTSKSSEDCYWTEQSLIKENLDNSLCLNKHYIEKGNIKFLRTGEILSEGAKNKMSQSKKNIPHTKEHNLQVSLSLKAKYNTPVKPNKKRKRKSASIETRNLMSISNLARPKTECPFCHKSADPGTILGTMEIIVRSNPKVKLPYLFLAARSLARISCARSALAEAYRSGTEPRSLSATRCLS